MPPADVLTSQSLQDSGLCAAGLGGAPQGGARGAETPSVSAVAVSYSFTLPGELIGQVLGARG